MSFRTFVFLLALPILAQAGSPPRGVDFSNYDVPLYTQITDHIKYRADDRQHLLLEPVDIKKDRYGFVYAPARNGDVPYNPLKVSSAYQR